MRRDYVISVRMCHCNGGGYVALSEDEDTKKTSSLADGYPRMIM
jgi:hypothetical protein